MPQVLEQPVSVYVHCTTPTCPGTFQEEVPGVRVETQYFFMDNGGDIPGVERSKVEARVVNEEDAVCPHCGAHRDASLEPRPQYERLSGFDPAGLLNMPKYDPSRVNTPADQHDAEVDALRAQIAEQRAQFEELRQALLADREGGAA